MRHYQWRSKHRFCKRCSYGTQKKISITRIQKIEVMSVSLFYLYQFFPIILQIPTTMTMTEKYISIFPRQKVSKDDVGHYLGNHLIVPRRIIPKSKLLDNLNETKKEFFYINMSKSDMNITI